VNGLAEGLWIGRGNGVVRDERYYKEGLPHGLWIEWHDNGQKSTEGLFQNGLEHGKWESWDADGHLIFLEYYIYDDAVTKAEWEDWEAGQGKGE